jgi:hypothetical protein
MAIPQREVVGVTSRYFLKDHLGSMRAVAKIDSSISMQYDYSLWGEQSVISGNNPADFGFTGHYTWLAPYRFITRGWDAGSAATRSGKKVG